MERDDGGGEHPALGALSRARAAGRAVLTEPEAKALLAWAGIPVPRGRVACSEDEAAAAVGELGTTAVLKVVSPDIGHKSDVGGVVYPVRTPGAARAAYRRIRHAVGRACPTARIDGVLVEDFHSGGVECVLGLTTATQLGAAVMFGLGGLFVEALQDVSFRLAPLLPEDAAELLAEARGVRCLDGFRGRGPVDQVALAEAILAVGRLACRPDLRCAIRELEINPLLAGPSGVVALDALVVLQPVDGRDA